MVWFGNNDDDERDPIASAPDPVGRTPEQERYGKRHERSSNAPWRRCPAGSVRHSMLRAWKDSMYGTRRQRWAHEGSVKTHYSRAVQPSRHPGRTLGMTTKRDRTGAGGSTGEACPRAVRRQRRWLDAATRSQLNRRRHETLEQATGGLAWRWDRLVPATGVAAAAVLAVLVVNGNRPDVAPMPTNGVADMEILLEGDELEMFEDLEFYTLLEFEANGEAHVG